METQYFSKNYFRDLFRPGGIEDEDGQMKKIRTLDGGLVTDPVEGVSGEEQYLKQVWRCEMIPCLSVFFPLFPTYYVDVPANTTHLHRLGST